MSQFTIHVLSFALQQDVDRIMIMHDNGSAAYCCCCIRILLYSAHQSVLYNFILWLPVELLPHPV